MRKRLDEKEGSRRKELEALSIMRKLLDEKEGRRSWRTS
jgi:hypothetical protein